MTGSLDNELPGDEIQETDLYINKHRYRSIPRYSYSFNQRLEVEVLEVSL